MTAKNKELFDIWYNTVKNKKKKILKEKYLIIVY